MKTTYESEMLRAEKLEEMGEYADAAQVRHMAERDFGSIPAEEESKTPKPEPVDYYHQAESFLARNGLKLRITLSNSKVAPWDEKEGERNHYRVTLSKKAYGRSYDNQAKRLTFDFWGSINDAQKGEDPSAYDVLACISGDTSCPDTFADFCAEYGENPDSIRANQLFRRCSSFAKRLRAFFTEKELEELSEIQ